MNTEVMLAIFALAAVFGLLGVIAVDALTIQKVDARGCHNSVPYNASKGRCFHPKLFLLYRITLLV
jgi:hypothetical protein